LLLNGFLGLGLGVPTETYWSLFVKIQGLVCIHILF